MEFSKWINLFVVLIMASILTTGVSFALQNEKQGFAGPAAVSSKQSSILAAIDIQNIQQPPSPPQKLANPPSIVKAVYVTGYSAGSKSYINYLKNLFSNTEINAVVVDIKGSDGYVSYASGAEEVKKYNLTNNAILDIDALIRFFHDQNIYVIGRIAVFEDPQYSKARPDLAIYNKEKTTDLSHPVLWQDNHGLSWLDPASKDVWNYDVSLAKDALYHGFDEINFDYVRFPSDGKTKLMGFPFWNDNSPMAPVIKDFFHYLRTSLPDDKISVDLFGLTTVNSDDMGIGQVLENAFENFDYIAPMVYPSHYANGFIGFNNPADHPYEVIKYSMDRALSRENSFLNKAQEALVKNNEAVGFPAAALEAIKPQQPALAPLAKFRPWIQDFNMGAIYNSEMVKQEIQATQDSLGASFEGFMLWNPSNIYTMGAISKPN
jgi:hypothetical protein